MTMAFNANTTPQELEPIIAKGIRLLHSSDPDSEVELYNLWEQCAREKFAPDRKPVSVLNKISVPVTIKRESENNVDEECTTEIKKVKRVDSPVNFIKSDPLQISPDDLDDKNIDSDNDSNDDVKPEMFTGDNPCTSCKSSTYSKTNILLECQQCHKFYHQKCDFISMLNTNLDDPRMVWYCSSCEDSIAADRNKASASSKSAKSSSSSSSSSKSSRSFGISSSIGLKTKIVSSGRSSSKLLESSSKSSSSDKKGGHSMNKRSSTMKKPEKKSKIL